ncbi:hypothetical protein B0T21DRAFT_143109 [Apiosordaria backusii]|uniref:Secreted protein n=1 Tax=Apiosordaria backusii TaxID=314023 RepID=A0AA40BSA6_9PEZI|nr:hypothetical protein B0T21DRAFT_143109 [Apiosordaria backusii]
MHYFWNSVVLPRLLLCLTDMLLCLETRQSLSRLRAHRRTLNSTYFSIPHVTACPPNHQPKIFQPSRLLNHSASETQERPSWQFMDVVPHLQQRSAAARHSRRNKAIISADWQREHSDCLTCTCRRVSPMKHPSASRSRRSTCQKVGAFPQSHISVLALLIPARFETFFHSAYIF